MRMNLEERNQIQQNQPLSTEVEALIALFNRRSYAEAESRTRALLEQYPYFGFGWKLLGGTLQMQGKEALSAFKKVTELMPDDAEAHYNLGVVLKSVGQLDHAMTSYRRAIQLKPDYAEAHSNLGNVQKDIGQLEDAVASYRRAVEIRPDFALAHNNLGSVLKALGQLGDAEASFQRAMRIKPDYVEALNNLAGLLVDRGEPLKALNFIVHSLRIEDRRETKSLFVNCVRRFKFMHVDGFVRDAMVRALSEPWCRPEELTWVCRDIVKLNRNVGECISRAIAAWPQRLATQELYGSGRIAAVSDDTLLRCFIKSVQICDLEMERFLTMVRFTLLVDASSKNALESVEENVLDFYCALAQQCFINEYVFAWTDAEAEQALSLRDSLAAALESEARVPVLWLVAAASYFPLNTIPFVDRLLERSWPRAVDAVLTQQVREPDVERQYRTKIPQLTLIDDEVSMLVQNQYEENPYPRWIKVAHAVSFGTVDRMLKQILPMSTFRPLGKNNSPDILIAGCGTGRQSIEAAQHFPGARVLAIDLSSTSLGYAKRKSQELGLDMIEYAQADIMKLGSLDRSFDVIESSGVLHHLADPLAGWQVLLSLLRPGGFMRLGFYSEVARQGVVLARTFISEHGYGSTAEDIRHCRQELLGSDDGASFGAALKLVDFFSTSACRDLLFHVQEHRMTLTGIDAFLRENDLRFLGFEHRPDVFQAYRLRFPEDLATTNLDNWQIFENENPDTFIGMYQFWIQKAS
jgi:tetratricopeptide (TPR) repeat protein/2-polyprenyl-3-methyl-5-hydroxy-6-metoxy-1,4-benzoquinol methylase